MKKQINMLSPYKTKNCLIYIMGKLRAKEKGVDDLLILNDKLGIIESSYFQYFEGCEMAKAIEFEEVAQFARPFPLADIASGMVAPQSFCYVEKDTFNRLKRRKSSTV